jgi:hypothetical protein
MDYKFIIKTLFICFVFLIIGFIVGEMIWKLWEMDRLNDCTKSCFYKETEIWCGMGCWSLFDKYNVNISNYKLPTECEVWGGQFPFLCKRD